jgi:hypothetical protein
MIEIPFTGLELNTDESGRFRMIGDYLRVKSILEHSFPKKFESAGRP